MRPRPALLERALARPRLAVALAATSMLVLVTVALAAFDDRDDGATTHDAQGLDAARELGAPGAETSSSITTTTTVPPTTTSTSTTSTTVAAPATTRALPPVTTAPVTTPAPPPTTAPPLLLPPPPAEPAAPQPSAPPPPSRKRCLVRFHGKGGSGSGVSTNGDVTVISPNGNADGWGGRQWLYFAPSSYDVALAGVAQAVDANGCGQVIVNGFSNGAAFAVKLYCRGESFGGRLVGVVADDPVPDHGADGCAPAGGVPLTMYWTGALAGTAQPGWDCTQQDWTCEGGTTVGIGAYAANAGTSAKASPYTGHQWYTAAPEVNAWR
jgi:hypothetical protein